MPKTPTTFREALPPTLFRQVTTAHPHRFGSGARSSTGRKRLVVIDDGWGLVLESGCGPLARLAARDLIGLMKSSFARTLRRGEASGGGRIRVRITGEGPREQYGLVVEADRVLIEAADDEAAMRALFHLGRDMLFNGGPMLAPGRWTRRPRWSLRIASPALHRGRDDPADYLRLPPAYLTNMARYGYNATFLYMDWFDYMSPDVGGDLARPGWRRRFGQLAEAVAYLGRFGVRTLFHVNTSALAADHPAFRRDATMRGAQSWEPGMHCLCTGAPAVLSLFRDAARELFTRVPGLEGLVLITGGECLLHCYTRPVPRTARGTNCPRCRRHLPDAVVAAAVNAIGAGAWAARPDARVLVWPYSAFIWADPPAQRRLLARMDRRVSSLVTFEKDDWHTIDGTRAYLFDYSLTNLGPSARFTSLQRAARRRGLRTLAKTETAQCIEIWNVPRIPAMRRWAMRYAALVEADLDGVHSSWRFYGFCAQRNDDIVDYFNWAPRPRVGHVLGLLAERDFGPAAAPRVLEAWDIFSRVMARFPYCAGVTGFPYWKGPFRQGPAHPFVFDLTLDHGLSERFWGFEPSDVEHHGDVERAGPAEGRRVTGQQPLFFMDLSWTQPFGALTIKRRLAALSRQWQRGVACLASARRPSGRRGGGLPAALDQELDIARMIGCMFRTADHLVRFQLLRDRVTREPSTLAILRRTCRQVVDVLEAELANAELGLELVEREPALGYGATYGRSFDADLIREKIIHTRRQIDEVVPHFFEMHAFHMFASNEELGWRGTKARRPPCLDPFRFTPPSARRSPRSRR